MPKLNKYNLKLDTKDLILNAARDLFYKKGFETTTFADIAKKVGISQPSIYAHYDNKMDLLKNVCVTSIDITRAYIDSRVNPNDKALIKLKSYLSANLDFFRNEKIHAYANLAFYFFSSTYPEMIDLYHDSQSKAVQRLSAIVFQAGHEGLLDLAKAESLSQSLHSMLIGECYKAVYAKNDIDFKKIKIRVWNFIETQILV